MFLCPLLQCVDHTLVTFHKPIVRIYEVKKCVTGLSYDFLFAIAVLWNSCLYNKLINVVISFLFFLM
jgi:hypothetical protein